MKLLISLINTNIQNTKDTSYLLTYFIQSFITCCPMQLSIFYIYLNDLNVKAITAHENIQGFHITHVINTETRNCVTEF